MNKLRNIHKLSIKTQLKT